VSPSVSALIATAVSRENAAAVVEQCQAGLCLAGAEGDLSDFLALQGKLHQARGVMIAPVVFGQPGFGLRELLRQEAT